MKRTVLLLAVVLALVGEQGAQARVLVQKTLTATPEVATWTTTAGGKRTGYISVYSGGHELKEHVADSGLAATYYGRGIFARARIKGRALILRYVSLGGPRKMTIRIEDQP